MQGGARSTRDCIGKSVPARGVQGAAFATLSSIGGVGVLGSVCCWPLRRYSLSQKVVSRSSETSLVKEGAKVPLFIAGRVRARARSLAVGYSTPIRGSG